MIRLPVSFLAAMAMVSIAHAQQLYPFFLTPGFVDEPNTEFSSWDSYYAPNDGLLNYPDVWAPYGGTMGADGREPTTATAAGFPINPDYDPDNPTAFWDTRNPTIAQLTNQAFLTGTIGLNANIYSFSAATQFELVDTPDFSPGTVVFQFQTEGTPMDYDSIRLFYAGGPAGGLAPNELIKEYIGSTNARGGVQNRSAAQWDLTGMGVSNYEIRFEASDASMSFQRALLDTAMTYEAVVPESRLWDAGGGVGTNWTNGTNWSSDSAPEAGANVNFSGGSQATLNSSQQVGELTFSAAGGFAIGATGGAALTINTGINVEDLAVEATYTINAPVVMGGMHYHTIGENARVVLNGNITTSTYLDPETEDMVNVIGGFVKEGKGELVINGNIGPMSGSMLFQDGTLVLNGTNNYSGENRIWGGTLILGNDSPLSGAGALGTNSSAIQIGLEATSPVEIPFVTELVIDGAHTIGKHFTLVENSKGEAVVFGARDASGGAAFTGNLTFNTTTDVELKATQASDRVRFSGNMASGQSGRTLTKVGQGTVILSGNNKTYLNNTIVQAGTLEIASGTSVIGNGTWTIANGATVRVNGVLGGNSAFTLNGGTLTGSGTVNRGVTIDGGDRVAPGLNVGTLILAAGASWGGGGAYDWQIAGVSGTPGVQWDLLQITGALSLSASVGNKFTLDISAVTIEGLLSPLAGFDSATAYEWVIATASGGISGFDANAIAIDAADFGNAPNGNFSLSVEGNSLVLHYAAVPEPSTLLLLGIGSSLAIWTIARQRRRL